MDALRPCTSPSLCNLRISFDRSNANKFTGSIRARSFIFPRKIIRLNGNGRENWRCPGSQTEASAERNLFVWRNFQQLYDLGSEEDAVQRKLQARNVGSLRVPGGDAT